MNTERYYGQQEARHQAPGYLDSGTAPQQLIREAPRQAPAKAQNPVSFQISGSALTALWLIAISSCLGGTGMFMIFIYVKGLVDALSHFGGY